MRRVLTRPNKENDMTMKVKLSPHKSMAVLDWAHASREVRKYIEQEDLGSSQFVGGTVTKDGERLGYISYNGRAWDKQGKEIKL